VAEGMAAKDGFGPCIMEQTMVAGTEESCGTEVVQTDRLVDQW